MVDGDNADVVSCRVPLFVEGAERAVTLSFPENTVLRYGDKRTIPVSISSTVIAQLSEYRLRITYDPALLTVHRATSSGTLT